MMIEAENTGCWKARITFLTTENDGEQNFPRFLGCSKTSILQHHVALCTHVLTFLALPLSISIKWHKGTSFSLCKYSYLQTHKCILQSDRRHQAFLWSSTLRYTPGVLYSGLHFRSKTAYSVMIFMLPDLRCKYMKYSVWIPLRNMQIFERKRNLLYCIFIPAFVLFDRCRATQTCLLLRGGAGTGAYMPQRVCAHE